jgi:hypothetical protein
VINVKFDYPKLASDSLFTDKDVKALEDVEPFVRDALIQIFNLTCGAKWRFSCKSTSDLYFTLYGRTGNAQTGKGNVSLGEYSISFLRNATQDKLDEKFRQEIKRVNKFINP